MNDERHCKRCQRTESENRIEKHHIIPKSEGGHNGKSNLRDLCSDCHDFIHTKRNLETKIKYYQKMIDLSVYRLQVLENLNTVELIKENGYRSYWLDELTHGDSNRKFKRRRKKKNTNEIRKRRSNKRSR